MDRYIDKSIIDYRAQSSSIFFTKLKSMFTENQLSLPKITSIEVRGKNKKRKKKEECHDDEDTKNGTPRR